LTLNQQLRPNVTGLRSSRADAIRGKCARTNPDIQVIRLPATSREGLTERPGWVNAVCHDAVAEK
jgi:hypothetical protein